MYTVLKTLHLCAAATSLTLFLFRAQLMLRRSAALEKRLWRTVPHVVDTLLLASGVGLLFLFAGAPLAELWFQFKLVLLMAYIFFGALALRYGRTYRIRAGALVVALVLFALIVATAFARVPFGLIIE